MFKRSLQPLFLLFSTASIMMGIPAGTSAQSPSPAGTVTVSASTPAGSATPATPDSGKKIEGQLTSERFSSAKDANDLSDAAERKRRVDESQSSSWVSALAAALSALTTCASFVWGVYCWRRTQQAEAAKRRLEASIYAPVPIDPGDYKTSALVVGLGGCGKSAIIKTLSSMGTERPPTKTTEFDIKHYEFNEGEIISGDSKPPAYHLYLADYRGQDLSDLIGGFIEAQLQPYSAMAYDYIEALVLVVDLAGDGDDLSVGSRDSPDNERIEKNIAEWSQSAINAVFGLLTDSLRVVCLFINKSDALKNHSPEQDTLYIELFKPICERLEARGLKELKAVPDDVGNASDKKRKIDNDDLRIPYVVILGSGKRGDNVPELGRLLHQYRVPGRLRRRGTSARHRG